MGKPKPDSSSWRLSRGSLTTSSASLGPHACCSGCCFSSWPRSPAG